MNPQALNLILGIIETGAIVAQGTTSGDAQKGAALATGLATIIQKALAAHIAITGQPIDPDLLKPFEPLV